MGSMWKLELMTELVHRCPRVCKETGLLTKTKCGGRPRGEPWVELGSGSSEALQEAWLSAMIMSQRVQQGLLAGAPGKCETGREDKRCKSMWKCLQSNKILGSPVFPL